MGLERLEFGVRVRKFMVISVKTCYRLVWNHPFLVGLVCFLIFLYRSFPFLFSFLVTASPVLVCTAVLLGTLLSFGSPNIPEIDEKEEEKVSHEVSQLKTAATEDDTVLERDFADGDFVVERHVGKRWDVVEKADEKVSLVDNEVSEVVEGDGLVLYKLLVNDDSDSRDIRCENGVIHEVEELLNHSSVEKKMEIREEMLGSEGLLSMATATVDQHLLADKVGDWNLEVHDGKLTLDFSDLPRGDELDSSLVLSWKRVAGDEDAGDGGEDDDGNDDDDESLDSGSDGAESSSPDASMADISLMLDELHPLLGAEDTRPVQLSLDSSDAASESSHSSSNGESVDSDELENKGGGDNDDAEQGEGAKGDKADESKSAIKWTEDDQKILMDLGTSELERNQRLDKLIARRRARKSMRLMAEKNLIDLDSADIPLNIAPISTRRGNPFDLPYDSYDDPGLPPIPGSAPSVLQPRKNPFDLPYDSSEEKPDLKGDSFQEEFSGFDLRETVSRKEVFFRRHESFSVGPSSLGFPRQEFKWKPYFVPERLMTEGANPSLFQSQLSGVSESKLSSVPDSESVSSVGDEEDNNPNKQEVSREAELILNKDHASFRDEQESQSSEDVESVDVDQAENRDVHHDVVEITLGDGESQLEMESVSEAGATTHSELNASEIESTTQVDQARNRDVHHDAVVITLGDGQSQLEMEPNLSGARTTAHMELDASEIHPRTEPVEEDYSSRSSLSSLSEIDQKISDVKRDESAGFEPRDHDIKESGISRQPSLEELEFPFTSSIVDDNQHRDPIYDSSSASVMKFLSFSSVSSCTQAVICETGSLSMLVESPGKKPQVHSGTAEQGTSSFQEMHAGSLHLHNETEPRARDLPEISEHDVTYAGSSGVSPTSADHIVSTVPESVVEYVSRDAGSALDKGLKDVPNKEESFTQNQVDLSSLGAEAISAFDAGMGEVLDSSPEEQQHQMHPNESSEAKPVDRHVVDKEDTQFEQDEIHSLSSSEDNLIDGTVMPKEELIQTECDQMHLSNSDLSLDVDGHHENGEELSSTTLTYQHMPSNDVSSSTAEESGRIVVAQVQQVHPSEANFGEEHKMESEKDQVQSPCSDSNVDTGLDRDMNVNGIPSNSRCQDISSGENPSSELKKQLLCSDKSVDEPPINEHDKFEELTTESRGEVNAVKNDVNVHEVHDSEDKLSTNFSSMTPESTSSPAESPEHTLPKDQEDLKDKILNEIESEGPEEHFNYAEAYASHVDKENISEGVDEIKDIDERILSELDTVGDFNVREIGLLEGSHVSYTEYATLPDDIESETKTNLELPVLEARSLRDIDLAFKQLHEGVDVEELILPSSIENQQDHADTNSKLPVVEARSLEDIHNIFEHGPEPNPAELPQMEEIKTDTNVELLVLEARSVEDIDLAFKQLNEGVDVEEVILPSMVENPQDHADINSKLPVVEARSLEDIQNAFRQGPESNPTEPPHSTDLKIGSSEVEQHDVGSPKEIEVSNAVIGIQENSENAAGEPKNEYQKMEAVKTETNVELPVLEARSVQDIDLAFKQLREGVDVEEVILPSMIENQQDHAEARSLEDIHNAFRWGPESNQAELLYSSDLRIGSSEVEQHDVVSNKEIEVSNAVSGIQESSENAAGEPNNEYEEMEEMKTETNVELLVLEARSVQDIDLAFKQLREGVDVEKVILPSVIENQQDHADTNSKLPVVEARSLEDIHNAVQQGPEPNPAELPHPSDLRIESSEVESHGVVSTKEIEVSNAVSGIQENSENAAGEPKNEYEEIEEMKMETNVELPVVEARSVEDIDLAFKKLHEGVDAAEIILPRMIENKQDQADSNAKLPVVEARSLEDIHTAFQQGPESNPSELPHSSDLRIESLEVESHDLVSTKETEVTNVVSGIQEHSQNAAGEPRNKHEEEPEKSNLNLRGKNAKSHDSSSSSSSSPSSSDSE